MALGFYEQWVNGQRVIAHGGDTVWFHSYLWLFPDADTGVFISINSAGKDGAAGAVRSALFHKFADSYLQGSPERPAEGDGKNEREHAEMVVGNLVRGGCFFNNLIIQLGL